MERERKKKKKKNKAVNPNEVGETVCKQGRQVGSGALTLYDSDRSLLEERIHKRYSFREVQHIPPCQRGVFS